MIPQELGPLLIAVGLPLAGFALLGQAPLARVLGAASGAYFAARYMAWRWGMPLPEGGLFQTFWAWSFLLVETFATLSGTMVLVFMARTLDRTPEVDAWAHSPLVDAPTDVFICTYNEGPEILERTIVGATRIAHADLAVWVLDDGARDWVRDMAVSLGAHYVRRVKGKHAKAGNVNNGLAHALAPDAPTGRRPEFMLLIDADFIPGTRILQRVLPLFHSADVGIVQTPQHFFNPDPVQANLMASNTWPDEQRFFFNVLLPSKDAWGAAFCCGTSAVFRMAALEQAGGMAVETVTEDMLTSFKLGEHGWRTIFLHERLSVGLAPEGLSEYIGQRARWCLGTVQQVYTRWSPLGRARMTLINRISAFDAVMYWAVSFPYRLMALAAPALYWWLGISTYAAAPADLLVYLAPSVLASMVFMAAAAGNRVSPILTDVSQLLCSVAVVRTVAHALVKPFGHAFKVTAKGRSTDQVVVQWPVLWPFALLAVLTSGGLLANLSEWGNGRGGAGYVLNVAWSLMNTLLLSLAVMACVELPRPRREERFNIREPALLRPEGGETMLCTVEDMGVTGARLACAWETEAGGRADLLLDGGALVVPLEVVRVREGGCSARFITDRATRHDLIAKLYTGRYTNDVTQVDLRRSLVSALKRLLG